MQVVLNGCQLNIPNCNYSLNGKEGENFVERIAFQFEEIYNIQAELKIPFCVGCFVVQEGLFSATLKKINGYINVSLNKSFSIYFT